MERKRNKIRDKLYLAWKRMKQRCQDESYHSFHRYGGRGILFHPDWETFEVFFKDMKDDLLELIKKQPDIVFSLDRIDNNKNYSKENCRWATPLEQANNTIQTKFLNFNGENFSISEWERKLAFKSGTIKRRLQRGWSVEKALTQKVK